MFLFCISSQNLNVFWDTNLEEKKNKVHFLESHWKYKLMVFTKNSSSIIIFNAYKFAHFVEGLDSIRHFLGYADLISGFLLGRKV
jgi:hypothetical protein